MNATRCYKCLGTGRFDAFAHVAGGRCFMCGGTGTTEDATAAAKPGRKTTAPTRAECIEAARRAIEVARSYTEGGRRDDHATAIAEAIEDGSSVWAWLPKLAPADVVARARRAMLSLGYVV